MIQEFQNIRNYWQNKLNKVFSKLYTNELTYYMKNKYNRKINYTIILILN